MLAYKVLGRVSRTRNCDGVRLQLIEGLFEASEGASLWFVTWTVVRILGSFGSDVKDSVVCVNKVMLQSPL